jgi:hypothetical protein
VQAGERQKHIDRGVDLASVILLSIVAIVSALAVYQSSRWSGRESAEFARSSAYRTQNSIELARSNVLQTIDAALALRYLDALRSNDKKTQKFYGDRFRPEARAAMQAWIEQDPLHNRSAPATPFALPQYELASDAKARTAIGLADQATAEAEKANQTADDFLLLTVIFSTVAFMSGISTKFRFPFNVVAVCIAFAFIVYGVARMMALPFLSFS